MKPLLLLTLALGFAAAFGCRDGRLDAFESDAGAPSAGGGSGLSSGTGGSGGEPSEGGASGEGSEPDTLVIDDFEDGDQLALVSDGYWYVSNDGTGSQRFSVEPTPDNPLSLYAAHTSGVGFATFGALLGLDLAGSGSGYDARSYAALTFSARAKEGSTPSLLFAFLVGNLHYAVPITLGTEWEVHTVPFADALPVEDDAVSPFDPRRISGIQFFVLGDASFDFWLDDLAFVK